MLRCGFEYNYMINTKKQEWLWHLQSRKHMNVFQQTWDNPVLSLDIAFLYISQPSALHLWSMFFFLFVKVWYTALIDIANSVYCDQRSRLQFHTVAHKQINRDDTNQKKKN